MQVSRSLDRVFLLLASKTGYQELKAMKSKVLALENEYVIARNQLKSTKAEYQKLVQDRSRVQRDMNSLLQRKHNWSPDDVNHFTQLYSRDHQIEQMEGDLEQRLNATEQTHDQAHSAWIDALRDRFREESLWSDHIRMINTYWTMALVGVNIVTAVGVYSFIEPRKRQMMLDQIKVHFDQTMLSSQSQNRLVDNRSDSVLSKDQSQSEVTKLLESIDSKLNQFMGDQRDNNNKFAIYQQNQQIQQQQEESRWQQSLLYCRNNALSLIWNGLSSLDSKAFSRLSEAGFVLISGLIGLCWGLTLS
ncbi:hypothetical protein MIR68_012227 [Amoeboaphelidium protococcarum]|nr:hypothetical protein MIR68_012227 [Amoeboaphelidium protococcarum]